jgi:hypothetical protein
VLAVIASAVVIRDRRPAAPVGVARARASVPEASHDRELAALLAYEQQRRSTTDFAAVPPSDVALGPDPYRIAALGDDRFVGVLRGESAVVVLGRDGSEQARAAAPRSPGALAVSADGDVLVASEAERGLVQYRATAAGLARVATIAVDALGIRDVALAPDGRTAYVVEERDGRLLAVALARGHGPARALRATGVRELGRCHGPIQVAAIDGGVAVDCLLDHAIEIRRGDAPPVRIHHDGPIWRFALRREPGGGLLVAAGGIEDHPLEREDGGFGYIDSFAYLYRLAPGAAEARRLAAINTSELGVVTPKWIAFRPPAAGEAPGDASVIAAGYATPDAVTLTWRGGDFAAPPRVDRTQLVPGTADGVIASDGALVAANPLFDAWVIARGGAPVVAPASPRPPRPLPSRIGELLFFTTLMSPWNSAEGKLSRFTCETCHHEGYVDGRTHFTGRGTVFATTRPLYGLFNNRPHFSRALDRTTTQMIHAEFRVANRHNGRDPWFALTRADAPWLAYVPGGPGATGELAPEALRQALMAFLADFTHRPNPAAIDHARFTALEQAGARAFRDRCADCHAARLVADDPATLVPFERWESLVLSPVGPIVWSNAEYARTGVVPYVHDSGARTPPLRRLYKKWPYFTNGHARSLSDLLDRFATADHATAGATTYHDGAPPDAERLPAADKAALLAFLDLL